MPLDCFPLIKSTASSIFLEQVKIIVWDFTCYARSKSVRPAELKDLWDFQIVSISYPCTFSNSKGFAILGSPGRKSHLGKIYLKSEITLLIIPFTFTNFHLRDFGHHSSKAQPQRLSRASTVPCSANLLIAQKTPACLSLWGISMSYSRASS